MAKQTALLFFAWAFVSLTPSVAQAFQLGDHAGVTRVAMADVVACVPGAKEVYPSFAQDTIMGGVLQEDLNIIRKWYRYSHYYNPYKKLTMRRVDAGVSVAETEAELVKDGFSSSDVDHLLLGRAIHYIQDMAVPPHVVPVEHGLNDGFESLLISDLKTHADCAWFQSLPDTSLQPIFSALAMETYDETTQSTVSYLDGGISKRGTWAELFWTPGANFGKYGAFGNNYGKTEFKIGSSDISVDLQAYQDFKLERMQRAVEATRQALMWFAKGSAKFQ